MTCRRRAAGQVHILTGHHRLPAAQREVGVTADAEIRAVHVRVIISEVMAAEPFCPDSWAQVRAGHDRSQDQMRIPAGRRDHIGQPAGGNLGVGVCTSEPQLAGTIAASQSGAGPGPAGGAHAARRDGHRPHIADSLRPRRR